MIINCRKIARKIVSRLKNKIAAKRAKGQTFGAIACVEWREHNNSDFSAQLSMAASRIGVEFQFVLLAENASTDVVCAEIQKLAQDKTCGGIAANQQMPKGINVSRVLDTIPPGKDIDCVHDHNRGMIADFPEAEFLPPAIGAARSVFRKLNLTDDVLRAKKVVFVGKGFSICRPIYLWLLAVGVRDLGIIDTTTALVQKIMLLATADIIICGAVTNKALVVGEMVKRSVVVLDYGAPTPNVDAVSIDAAGGIVTPNPGGLGPLVIAHMLKNFVILNSGI